MSYTDDQLQEIFATNLQAAIDSGNPRKFTKQWQCRGGFFTSNYGQNKPYAPLNQFLLSMSVDASFNDGRMITFSALKKINKELAGFIVYDRTTYQKGAAPFLKHHKILSTFTKGENSKGQMVNFTKGNRWGKDLVNHRSFPRLHSGMLSVDEIRNRIEYLGLQAEFDMGSKRAIKVLDVEAIDTKLIDQFVAQLSEAQITISWSDSASCRDNRVSMPKLEAFDSLGSFLQTFLHELLHVTGYRLNRETYKHYHEDRAIRAREELTVEFASMQIMSELGLTYDNPNSCNYLASWASAAKHDKTLLKVCARDAVAAIKELRKMIDLGPLEGLTIAA